MTVRHLPSHLLSAATARWTAALTIAVAVASAAGLAQQATRQDPLPLTLENIYKGGRGGAGNPTISPDGKWVTFTGRTARGIGLHRMSPNGGEPEFWGEAGGIEWAPDSQSVAFARGDRLWKLGGVWGRWAGGGGTRGSYGGMPSMAAITWTPDKLTRAVPMRGIYRSDHLEQHMDRLGKIYSKTSLGGLPNESPQIYSKANTLERFSAIKTPLLIMHGEADNRAPFKNHELAVAELKRLGKDFEAKTYPGEGHGFRNPDNQIDMSQRLEAFFVKHLGWCTPRTAS